MLDAVILGVQGVLVPNRSFQQAAIAAAAQRLAAEGVPPALFLAAAERRLAATGPRALVSRTLRDLDCTLPPQRVRAAVLAARHAIPAFVLDPEARQALLALAARCQLGFLDSGSPAVMDALLDRCNLGRLVTTRLWAESLGWCARPGRCLAFRWLARRLALPPSACVHVAQPGPQREAARRAGWQVWPHDPTPTGTLDFSRLLDWVDARETEH